MSYTISINTIHLRPSPRLAHTEYSDSEPLMRAVTGEIGANWNAPAFNAAWEIDLKFVTHNSPVSWAKCGQTTDMGHAEFIGGGGDFRAAQPCPFKSAAEVWAFDAVSEYSLMDMDELIKNEGSTELVNGGALDGIRLLSPSTVAIMDVAQSGIAGSMGEFGWDGAFNTYFWIDCAESLFGLLMMQHGPNAYFPVAQQFKQLTYAALVKDQDNG